MIKIRPHGTFQKGFTVEGHAGYAEHGQDIVCASVSVVTQMIAFELHLKEHATYEMNDGNLVVRITDRTDEYANDILDMMVRTLNALQTQYPTHIQIKEEF